MATFEVEEGSPRAFYVNTCKDMDVKVNRAFFNSLSPVPNDYDATDEIRLSNTYVGQKGVLAMLPVIAKCHRVQKIGMPQNGLRDDAATVQLINTLQQSCPELTSLDLSGNDVGSDVGVAIAKMLGSQRNKKLVEVDLQNTWIVLPILNKIKRMCAKNAAAQLECTDGKVLDLAALHSLPQEELYDQFEEIAACLFKHRYHMQDLWALLSTGADQCIPVPKFAKALRMIDVTRVIQGTPEDVAQRLTALADIIGVLDPGGEGIYAQDFMVKLRVHASHKALTEEDKTVAMQALVNIIFDSAEFIQKSLEEGEAGRVSVDVVKDLLDTLKPFGPTGVITGKARKKAMDDFQELILAQQPQLISPMKFLEQFEVTDDPAEHHWWKCSYILSRARTVYRLGGF
mmetsp:Transcript_9806/g.17313  ORF Transcript_9806/g.17313 Transcript_9806/m.17313 type:complete len:400 (-) Transcript_9806:1689-2888(-)